LNFNFFTYVVSFDDYLSVHLLKKRLWLLKLFTLKVKIQLIDGYKYYWMFILIFYKQFNLIRVPKSLKKSTKKKDGI